MNKKFDLNIEKMLENLEVYQTVHEIITNALDEQKSTGTKDISIYKETISGITAENSPYPLCQCDKRMLIKRKI